VLALAGRLVLYQCLVLLLIGGGGWRVQAADGGFTNWMETYFPIIKDKPLGRLVIPGTHDSGSYDLIDPWSVTDPRNFEISQLDVGAPDKPPELRAVLAAGGSFAKGWGAAQSRNITQQLEDGIRSLDLRVAVDKKGVLRVCHGLYGDRIDKILDEVKQFSDAHTKEIIILSFWAFHDWAEDSPGKMRADKHAELSQMIKSRFGNRIANSGSLTASNTISAFIAANKTIIVAYGNESAGDEDSQDRVGAWSIYGKTNGYWLRNDGMHFEGNNKAYTNGLQKGETEMAAGRASVTNRLFDLTGVSTSFDLVGRGFDPAGTYPRSLKGLAEDVTPVIVSWLDARNLDGSFVYTPEAGFTGTDSFVYKVQDEGGAQTYPTIVTIVVHP